MSRTTSGSRAVLGWHWKGLVMTTVLVILGLLGCLYYDLFAERTEYPEAAGLTFREFSDLHWFGRRRPLVFYLLAFARNGDLRLKFIWLAGSGLLIVYGFLVGSCWVAMHNHLGFAWVYQLLFPWFPYGALVPAAVWFLSVFLRREYRVYLDFRGTRRSQEAGT